MKMETKELYERYMITGMVAGFEPIEVESACGCTMTGRDGRTYLDCFAGIAVTNVGHNHPRVIDAARDQMERLVHCCTYIYYNPKAGELAWRLAEIMPGDLDKSFFSNSGAEAIEGALRIAKQHTGRRETVAMSHGFHGRTYATLSVTGNAGRKKGAGPYMGGVSFVPAPYCYRCPLGYRDNTRCDLACAQYLEHALKYSTSGDVAAFIAEPVLGEGGIIVPPEGYFRIVAEILQKHEIVFICDEVQSGFGRCGKMFAIERFGVEPDIVTTAKGIADGFPIGAFTTRSEISQAFRPGDHLSTFGGNPVSCAAAIANIEVLLGEKLADAAIARGLQLSSSLQQLQERYPYLGDIRGAGLMIGIEVVQSDGTPAVADAKALRAACREHGLLVGLGGTLGNVLRFQPPLTITEEQCIQALWLFERALNEHYGSGRARASK